MQVFRKIGVAVAFNHRGEALLAESNRLRKLFNAALVLIHVGSKTTQSEDSLRAVLAKVGLQQEEVTVCWESGDPASKILLCCQREGVDLLVAGALKEEKMIQYYLGSVARKILRKANCSVLMLLNPSINPDSFKNIVINAEDSPYIEDALQLACSLGTLENSQWLHVVREIKLYGLTMSASEQCTEEEYEKLRQNLLSNEITSVEKLLGKIPHQGLKINIKTLSGKSGFELAKFAERKKADLLIVGAPPRRFYFLDRIFPHDLEYVFANIPCNLLIVNPAKRKEVKRG